MPEDRLLTVKEVAARLRLSLAETYKLVQSQAIVHFRVGPGKGAIRIAPDALDAFLEKRRVGEAPVRRATKTITPPLRHVQRK